MVIRETERHDYPSYALERVHSLARRGNVCYLFRSTRRDIENLGYGLDDICTCLMAIQENDFDHAESYSDMLGRYDVYHTILITSRGYVDRPYIKFRISKTMMYIELASFHLDR